MLSSVTRLDKNYLVKLYLTQAKTAIGVVHKSNRTPAAAIALSSLITFLVPAILLLFGVKTFDNQGYFGTVSTYGFLLVYILVSIAAPVYLYRLSKLRPMDIVFSILGIGFVLLPILGTVGIPGSTLFPPPEPPQNVFPYLFLLYLAVGCGWFFIQRLRDPGMVKRMERGMEEIHAKFTSTEKF